MTTTASTQAATSSTATAGTLRVSARLFAACALFKATKDIRYYLTGIFVQPNPLGPGAIVCATDGHQIAVAFDADGEADSPTLLACGPSLAAAARKAAKQDSTVRLEGGKVYVMDEHGAELFIQPAPATIDGQFPNVARVLPGSTDQAEPGLNQPLNPLFIARIAAANKLLNRSKFASAASHWSFGNHRAVITRLGCAPEIVIGTMPMRDSAVDHFLPAGLRGPVDHLQRLAAEAAEAEKAAKAADANTVPA